ncbi:MAG TPA: M23 family metallopeptidase [Rhizomicrobium sp.]|jgi:murein DD-endopeptidase MepM/ murein hydrolase activator NlpD|nr:M23 family metallopeptidase [Rhizomicrobium sp.]
MAETLIERAWTWLHATFPERQIYIRSQGRVQFFTFGATLQATCAGLSLIVLGWMAFASVNVIFKDHIIAAKDHRFQQMQGTYENRVADLQLSYDELNNALVSAEDRFKSTADEVEAKQQNVAKLLNEKQVVDATLPGLGKSEPPLRVTSSRVRSGGEAASDSLSEDASVPAASVGAIPSAAQSGKGFSGTGASQLNVMPGPVEAQPTTGKPAKASMLGGGLLQFAESFFEPQRLEPATHAVNNPAIQRLHAITDRLTHLSASENTLLASLDGSVSARIADVKGVLGKVGLNPAQAEKSGGGMGGPLVPLEAVQIDGVSDPGFTQSYISTLAHTAELEALFAALRHVPLTTPVHGSQFEVTSGFGPRIDPFTGHVAFHPGVDFAGPWGSVVGATAPGTVVFAGPRAGYGNLVEIDHGYGFHTRYGHLASVLVRAGSRVEKGTPVGRLGSTGRSTGPHVHYEVWLAEKLRDPARYIETGRHVLQ